ncbi:MAG: hypothetical protein IJG87_09155 [Ruminococcus sp.]|nr:hypothetical protein [Ruminococcus sp.]
MKDQLKQAIKPTPERFRYAVRESVNEAVTQSSPTKKRLSKGGRIVIAVAILAALIPSAVFGASKLYGLFAKPVEQYGLAIGTDETQAADYPLYVKMHVDIPEGFAVVPNTDDLKYYRLNNEDTYESGFSLYPMRANGDQKAYIANVENYTECTVSGHPAYAVRITNIKGNWDQLYVWFEDVNVMLLIEHKGVTKQQIIDFVDGISFTEGTSDDCTALYEPYDERQTKTYKYEETFIEQPLDTKLTFKGYSKVYEDESLRYTAQIGDIRVTDTIEGLDESCFNQGYSPNEIADENGKLVTKEFRTFCEGDGFNSTYEELSCEQKEQKMILAEVTYENLTDEDLDLFVTYHLNVMNKDGENSFTHAETIDPQNLIYSTECCDTEITYLSPHGEGKSFYIPTLPEHEKMTVTFGFRCNADMLDRAYLCLDNVNEVVEPAIEGAGDYVVYLFEVTEND